VALDKRTADRNVRLLIFVNSAVLRGDSLSCGSCVLWLLQRAFAKRSRFHRISRTVDIPEGEGQPPVMEMHELVVEKVLRGPARSLMFHLRHPLGLRQSLRSALLSAVLGSAQPCRNFRILGRPPFPTTDEIAQPRTHINMYNVP